MPTPLFISAINLHELLTSFYLYRHEFYYDPSTRRWNIHWNRKKLCPFYCAFWVVSLWTFSSCLLTLKFIANSGSFSWLFFANMLILACMGASTCGLCCLTILFGSESTAYWTTLADFRMKVTFRHQSRWVKPNPLNLKLIFREIQMLLRESSISTFDVIGWLMINNVIYNMVGSIFIPPFAVYFRLDPIYYLYFGG